MNKNGSRTVSTILIVGVILAFLSLFYLSSKKQESSSGWVSPNGFLDPDSEWTDEANAYDGNETSFCWTLVPTYPAWTPYVYFTFASPISASEITYKLKGIDVAPATFLIDIDVSINGAWATVFREYQSDYPEQWYNISFEAGVVSQIRLRCQSTYAEKYFGLSEIKLWKFGG